MYFANSEITLLSKHRELKMANFCSVIKMTAKTVGITLESSKKHGLILAEVTVETKQ